MTSITSSVPLAGQALKTVLNTPLLNTLSPLLKIATVTNTGIPFSLTSAYLSQPNTSLDESDPTKINLVEKFKHTIKDFHVDQKSLAEKYNLISEKNNELRENENFRLASVIDTLLPHNNVSLDHIDRLVIFGDSLSDSNGRMFEKSLHIIPSYNQYYEGRFTNGFVWGEYLSSPAFLNKKMVNFSEGGSTSASYSLLNFRSNFLSNINHQMKDYQPSEKDLTIIFAGANDYIVLHKHDILKVVEEQIDSIEKLLSGGVKNVLVMGMPDISLTPEAETSKHKREYKDIAIAHNHLLRENITELQVKYPEAKIFFFDTSAALNDIVTIARDIGYDTTHPYNTHGYIHNPMKKEPKLNILPKYLYNDSVHPTQEVHQVFAMILNKFIVDKYSGKTSLL